MLTSIHIVAEGLVQGVGFRWFVARQAEALGLTGYAKNLYDGSVEIVASGDRSLVEEFVKKVRVGPRSAHVTNLVIRWEPEEAKGSTQHFTHFEIR